MGDIRESIHVATNQKTFGDHDARLMAAANQESSSNTDMFNLQVGPKVGPEAPRLEEDDEEEKRTYERWQSKKDAKDYRKNKEVILEGMYENKWFFADIFETELVPKKTGREATLEKKKMKSDYTRRNKDDNIDMELGDGS